jgi:hypothetical protein
MSRLPHFVTPAIFGQAAPRHKTRYTSGRKGEYNESRLQTINPKTRLRGTVGYYFGLNAREYIALGKFSNALDPLGVKTTGIGKGPFGRGCFLKMASPSHEYELHVDGTGHALLGQVKDGRWIRLCEASSNVEAGWEKLFAALKTNEGRLS